MNDWCRVIKELPYIQYYSKMSGQEKFLFTAVILVLYISAGSFYILGTLVGLPSVIVASMHQATVVYLLGQLSFMVVMAVALFKISQLIINGVFFFWIFCISKFYLAPKRPRGLRHPTVVRLQLRMNSAVVEGRMYANIIFWIRISATALFIALVFFPIEGEIITSPSRISLMAIIFFGGITAILATLSVYRVGAGKTHREFFASPLGAKFGVVGALYFFMILGVLRSTSMMYGPVIYYHFKTDICELAPMVPVNDGHLYFDRDSQNFIIMSDGKIFYYIPHYASLQKPDCI